MDGIARARVLLKIAAEEGAGHRVGVALRRAGEGLGKVWHGSGEMGGALAHALGGTGELGQSIGRAAGKTGLVLGGLGLANHMKEKVDAWRFRHGMYPGA